jgi:hypothetical protein
MQGYITTRHLLLCGVTIIRAFGLRTWLRCAAAVLAHRPTTFLALAVAVPARGRQR